MFNDRLMCHIAKESVFRGFVKKDAQCHDGCCIDEHIAVNVGKACGGPEKDSVRKQKIIPVPLRAGILIQFQGQDLASRKVFVVVSLPSWSEGFQRNIFMQCALR
jgi:hypothetical protein